MTNQDQSTSAAVGVSDGDLDAGRWRWDLFSTVVDWSPELRRIYGLGEDDARRTGVELFSQMLHPDDRSRVMATVSRTFASGRAGHSQYFRIVRPDGAVRQLLSRARLVRDAEGRAVALVGMDVDLSSDDLEIETLSGRAPAEPDPRDPLDAPPLAEADPVAVALRERDDLRQIIDAMPVMVTLYDPEIQLVLLNRTFEEATGWTPEALGGREVMEACYPDPAYRAEVGAFMAAAAGWKTITLRRADGRDIETRWTNVRLSAERQLGIGLDLTAQRSLERALSVSETSLKLAQETAGIGAFDWDIAQDVNRWTPEIERLYGLPEGGFDGTYAAWAALVHPDDLPGAEAAVREALERTGRFETEWRIRRPDGDTRWLEARAVVETDDAGAPQRMIGVNVDITQRKALEAEARREAERARAKAEEFEALSADAPIGIALFDADFRYLWCNAWLAGLNGVETGDCVGRRVEEVLSAHTAEALREMQPRLLAGETVRDQEIAFEHPRTGEAVAFIVSYRPLRDARGRVTRILGTVADVSERKRAEAARELALREMAHRVKNSFAVVTAIAARTFGRDEASRPKLEIFSQRLVALSETHDLLVRRDWADASLHEVVTRTVSAVGVSEESFAAEGPALSLSPSAASMLGLAFHELATNALKYGAFSRDDGSVEIGWRIEEEEEGGGRRVRLTWRERGGPETAPPEHRGFGSQVIETLAMRELQGEAALRFAPEGLICRMSWPLPEG